jgi:hypothetical protein
MNDMLLQYLGGLIATSIVLFIASFNYVRSKQEKIHYLMQYGLRNLSTSERMPRTNMTPYKSD